MSAASSAAKKARRLIIDHQKKKAEELAGKPVEVVDKGGENVLFDGKPFDVFEREIEADRSRGKQKRRRGFISTILASNDEEGQVRRPSLLS